jgi:hypothetical protein
MPKSKSSNKLRVVAFNGPPRTGKDTLANLLKLHLMSNYETAGIRVQLSLPMREAAFAMAGLGEYDEETYEKLKDEVLPITGATLRQLMIDLSEEHVKPKYGKQFWVKSAMARIPEGVEVAIVSDLGFWEELDFLQKTYGARNVVVVNTHREGKGWGSDSRKPLTCSQSFQCYNNATPNQAAAEIRKYLRDLWGLKHPAPVPRLRSRLAI